MRFRNSVSTLIFPFVIWTLGFCQGERDPTVAESLTSHNIALTKSAVIAGLRNPDEEVRALAALMLAQDKTADAVPFIAQALARERVPKTSLDIAMALAQFRDERGFAALKAVCSDLRAHINLRLVATTNMLNLGDDSCSSAVVDTLQSKADHDYLMTALSLVPQFHHPTGGDPRKILDLVVKALDDKEPSIRISASDALGKLGNASAIPFLQTAIENEREGMVRSQLQTDLHKLRQKNEGNN